MTGQEAIKIPEIPGKITFMKKEDTEYVRYLAGRRYNPERKYNEPEWVLIGRKVDEMPGLMYPNDNYEKYFREEAETTAEEMTTEEQAFVRNSGIYGMYAIFFDGLYHEFRQQTRKRADMPVNPYKAESINKVLEPLREMMKDEEYAGFLGLIETGENGMSYSDAMILLTQYKSALGKWRRK